MLGACPCRPMSLTGLATHLGLAVSVARSVADYRLCAQLIKLAEFVGEVFPYGILDAGGRLVQVVDA
jgi:hypothetical protein